MEKEITIGKPLKNPTTGFEVETHIIDDEGNISYKAEKIINQVVKFHPKVDIVKECGKNMLELGCYPDTNIYNPAKEMLESIELVISIAKENNLMIYPFGTYPGIVKAKFTKDEKGHYALKDKIFGKELFENALRAVGFHYHFALPKSVFDYNKKNLILLIDSKLKRALLNCYNFEIAIDPILTLFTQSSPFFQGKLIAKDSRMLIYRGSAALKYKGVYTKHQLHGGLPVYKQTETDLIHSIDVKYRKWGRAIKKIDPEIKVKSIYESKLDTAWNPVKINKHGTIEQRGMDMNFLSINLATASLIKFCLKKIQGEYIEVIPSDIGINDAFKIRNGIMYIPPQSYVRTKLQRASAYEGFENEELCEYAKKFLSFAKSVSAPYYFPLIKTIEDMLEERKSTSDRIVEFAKENKLLNKNNELKKGGAQKIALHFSKLFEEDLKNLKKIVTKIEKKHEKELAQAIETN